MATITYAVALSNAINVLKEHTPEDTATINKLTDLYKQKTKKRETTEKSDARKTNEGIVDNLLVIARQQNLEQINNKWLRENVDGVKSPAHATAVLKLAVNMGKLTPHTVQKSATRNELFFTLN